MGRSIRKLSLNTRQVFSIMINRSATDPWGQPRVIIHEIEKVTGLDSTGIKEHYDLLYKYKFISKAEEDDEIYTLVVTIKPFKSSDWPFWIDLKEFCNAENIKLEEIVGQLNFGMLD